MLYPSSGNRIYRAQKTVPQGVKLCQFLKRYIHKKLQFQLWYNQLLNSNNFGTI